MRTRIILAVLAVLVLAVVSNAQTCTPVKLSKSYTTKDDGTGPYMTFVVNSTAYAQESSITLPAITEISTYTQYNGWVDVYASFNGCEQSWYITGFNYYYGLYDLTNGKWVYDTPQQDHVEDIPCGAVPACQFVNTGNSYNMGVVPGHHYHLWAFVSMGTSVGASSWYSDYVTLIVQ